MNREYLDRKRKANPQLPLLKFKQCQANIAGASQADYPIRDKPSGDKSRTACLPATAATTQPGSKAVTSACSSSHV